MTQQFKPDSYKNLIHATAIKLLPNIGYTILLGVGSVFYRTLWPVVSFVLLIAAIAQGIFKVYPIGKYLVICLIERRGLKQLWKYTPNTTERALANLLGGFAPMTAAELDIVENLFNGEKLNRVGWQGSEKNEYLEWIASLKAKLPK